MVVFGPWAFGTTQRWSLWTMNLTGYALGLLLAVKLAIRRFKGYLAPRWDHPGWRSGNGRRLLLLLAALTLCLLAYCLVSALNARATFRENTLTFEYRPCITWLPHSYDADGTWSAFWMYLGLACAFWATWDWVPGKTNAEIYANRRQPGGAGRNGEQPPLPGRLRRLLWLLALNGAVLGAECIIQRLAGSPRLLFLVEPRIHKTALAQFGPFAYRSNAAQYFNLLWPVCLGFWWTLHRRALRESREHHVLLVCAAIMAACPLVSTSRGGAFITLALAGLSTVLVAGSHRLNAARGLPGTRSRKSTVWWLAGALGTGLAIGIGLGWRALEPRLTRLNDGFEGREQMYEAARPMARDFPLFGTGPGTFETVSYLYPRPEMFWPAQLHNDWLETRLTFGLLGCGMLGLALLVVGARWLARGGVPCERGFVLLTWLALAGCLAHARYDFPFQIYSILFVFVTLCAVLFTVSK